MKINVFLRSTLRQPVRTILLLLITALLTFVFVSSGAQYLLINQETEELGGYYRSIGTLTTGNVPADRTADVSEAAVYLEESPYVELVDRVQTVSAVADVRNADTNRTNPSHMNADMYFYGTFLSASVGQLTEGYLTYSFQFRVDTVLAGYDEYLWDGLILTLQSPIGLWDDEEAFGEDFMTTMQYYFSLFQSYSVGSPYGVERVYAEDLTDPYVDLTGVYGELEVGSRYLLHGVYEEAVNTDNYLYSLDKDGAVFTMRSLTEDTWYYPVAEGEEVDFSAPALAGVAEAISRVNDNQHALLFLGSEDVSSMPGTQRSSGTAPVLANTILAEGRWPDAQDNGSGNRVCVIHSKFAAERGLSVGDTLTVTFRELLDMNGAPYLCMPDDLERKDAADATEAETFEIVGIFETDTSDEYYYSYLYNYVYVPASTLPQTFAGSTLTPYYLSFVLTSPEVEDQFIVETREALSDMGFQARFLPTNYDSFHAAARPLRFSALYNTVIFSMVLLVALCLVVFLYFRMRRKDVAIARALGLPVGQGVRQVSLPQLLIGLAGILAGGCAGWRYTLENAGQTLSVLSEIMEESGTVMAALSVGWLALLLAACFALLLILTLGSAVLTAKKPVLIQLQGGATLTQTS